MNRISKYIRSLLTAVLPFIMVILAVGCNVPDKYDKPVWQANIENDIGINGTQMRLYLQCESTVKSILPWEHFLEFGNYDIIGVDTGIIKAATIKSGVLVLPEQNVTSASFLDAQNMGFDGGIFLCCTNLSVITSCGLSLSSPDDTINGYAAYNLN